MALPLLLLRTAALARTSSGEPDCQLNGAAPPGSTHCVCDRGWKGAACGELDVAAEPVVAYGAGSPLAENHSSWGGGPPVFDGKEWHLFVSEIAAHCGMQCWSRLSQATHAVSASPTGPFRRRGVVIPTQTHNTYYTYSKPDRVHLLYHIFSGTSPRSCNPVSCQLARPPPRPLLAMLTCCGHPCTTAGHPLLGCAFTPMALCSI